MKDKSLAVFFLFLPLFSPIAYAGLLFSIIGKIREFNLKKISASRFLFIDFVFLALLAITFISSILSPYRGRGLAGFILLCLYLTTHFLVRESTRRKREKFFLNFIFFSLLVLCGFGILQYLLNLNFSLQSSIFNLSFSTKGGITSLIGQQNRFASFLVLALPLVMTSFSSKKNIRGQIFLASLLFLGFICLFLTRSLGGMVALGTITAVYLLMRNWRVGLATVAVGGFILLLSHDSLARIIEQYGTIQERIFTWIHVCIPLIKDHPFLGTGLASYSQVAPLYASGALKNHAHSLYLNYLSEIGTIGGSVLFLSIGIPIYYFVRTAKQTTPPLKQISTGLALSMGGILIFGITETVLNNFRVGLFLWSLLGIGLGIYSREKTSRIT